jgi:hypothetical protein
MVLIARRLLAGVGVWVAMAGQAGPPARPTPIRTQRSRFSEPQSKPCSTAGRGIKSPPARNRSRNRGGAGQNMRTTWFARLPLTRPQASLTGHATTSLPGEGPLESARLSAGNGQPGRMRSSAGFQWFDGKGMHGPLFDPSVAGPVFYKKGVFLIPSKPWAFPTCIGQQCSGRQRLRKGQTSTENIAVSSSNPSG